MPSEFELIEHCFRRRTRHTVLGIGDDAALIAPSAGYELAVSTDLLVEGTHFFADADPEALGWKTLAVNVSDLAAMSARPRWATLGIAVPPAPTFDWMDAFVRGFFACAEAFGVDLIGGDTTRSNTRCFSVTIFGEAPAGQAIRRSGAQPGDSIWVSGTPGRAALGLAHLQGRVTLSGAKLDDCLAALHRPQPRIELGQGLRGLASAAIDISDGMLADLGHILDQSDVAATIRIADLPPPGLERDCLLAGGDDYELLFTAAAGHDDKIAVLGSSLGLPLTRIGNITTGKSGDLQVLDPDGNDITPTRRGYDHFA